MGAGWFITDENRAWVADAAFAHPHDPWLAALSIVAAVAGSYTAFLLAARFADAAGTRARLAWLVAGAATMGSGIWTMHFVAMLAERLPVAVRYDAGQTALSMVFAVAASTFVFYTVGRGAGSLRLRIAGGVVLGGGIGAMHYTGMEAMRRDVGMFYDPYIFALSIVIAVALSCLALHLLARSLRSADASARPGRRRIIGGAIMGLSIAAMHYIGMAGTSFLPPEVPAPAGGGLHGDMLALAVGCVTLLIIVFALSASVLDQRFKLGHYHLAKSETFLRTLVEGMQEGIISTDGNGVIETFNSASERIFGYSARDVVGRNVSMLMAASDAAEHDRYLAQYRESKVRGLVGSGVRELRGRRGDGIEFPLEINLGEFVFKGRPTYIASVRDISERQDTEAALRDSERRISAIAANIPGVLYRRVRHADGSFSYPYVSARAREVFGIDAETIMRDPGSFLSLIDPEHREGYVKRLAESAKTLTPIDVRLKITTPDGETRWTHQISMPDRRDNDRVIWDVVVFDVTALVAAEQQREEIEAALRESEDRHRQLVDLSPDSIVIHCDGIIVFANPEAARLYGAKTPEQLVGRRSMDFVPEDLRAEIHARRRRVEGGGAYTEFQAQTRRRLDGTPVDVETAGVPFPWQGQRAALVVTRDLTRRKEAEKALRMTQFTVDRSADAIYWMTWDARIVFANEAACRQLGYSRAELLKLRAGDIDIDFAKARRPPNWKKIISQGPLIFEGSHRTKGGKIFPVEISLNRIEFDGEDFYCSIVRDVSLRKRDQIVLEQAKEAAELANRTKSEFLANMSHELRTPLNAILGFSEIIRNQAMGPLGSEKYLEYAGDIHESGQHLLSLISDILDLSKVESGEMELDDEEIAVGDLVDSVMTLVRGRAREGGIRLEADLPDTLPLLRADRRKLKQILVNLLSNAIKFTPAGGRAGVRVQVRRNRGFSLEIFDTGIGIAKDDIATALTPFQQVDSALARKYEGTGLGLALTKALVELHGGTLSLKSRPNKGTTVTVRFPHARTAGAPDARRQDIA